MPSDQRMLASSQAGLRLIAVMTIYNSGQYDRLRQYVREHFDAALLAEHPAAEWIARFKLLRADAGRLRVRQVVAVDKHRAIVLLESERETLLLGDMACGEEYPHPVLALDVQALPPAETDVAAQD